MWTLLHYCWLSSSIRALRVKRLMFREVQMTTDQEACEYAGRVAGVPIYPSHGR